MMTTTTVAATPIKGVAIAYPMSVPNSGRRILCPLWRGNNFSKGTTAMNNTIKTTNPS